MMRLGTVRLLFFLLSVSIFLHLPFHLFFGSGSDIDGQKRMSARSFVVT